MVIRVQLFGPEAAMLGKDVVEVHLQNTVTSQQLLQAIQQQHPLLHGRIAVNHAFAQPEQVIGHDDEVALIGMVSGG
jgi:molybdopterin converting factor small subunit